MSAWDTCRELERVSRKHLHQHLFPTLAFDGRYVLVEKGAMAKEFQQRDGDYVINSDDSTAWRIEHKCEYTNRHGNFYVETFSNKSRGNPGWFWKLEADFLLYHFIREGEVYLLGLPALRSWLYAHADGSEPRAHAYRHKRQNQHGQMNDTWGYCVRIGDVLGGIQVQVREVPALVISEREPEVRMPAVVNGYESEAIDEFGF